MRKKRCLYCYEYLDENDTDYHSYCSKSFFGFEFAPQLEYSLNEISKLAEKIVRSQITIPGVQSKISLGLEKIKGGNRLTIVGLWDKYILKPPSETFDSLPENESLTLRLANLFGIKTIPFCLIRMASGELAYISKRIDRINGTKIPMEDMAQLGGKLTEDKYKSSLEQVAHLIKKFSSNPGLDLVTFFEIVLFSYLTGNADMHLKNFSIYYKDELYRLTAAYDLISTRLIIAESDDNEETALTLNGKKRKLNKKDFNKFAENIGLNEKVVLNIFNRFKLTLPDVNGVIAKSFLKNPLKKNYIEIITQRAEKIF